MRNKKGFTLIELMIVVVIIGILAALAIPRFMAASRKAKIAEARGVLSQIHTAASVYYEEHGFFPGTENHWFNDASSSTTNTWNSISGLIVDRPSGSPRFSYQITDVGTSFGARATSSATDRQSYDASLHGVPDITIDAEGRLHGGE